MEINEIVLGDCLQIDKTLAHPITGKFSSASDNYLDELEVFSDSIEIMMDSLGDTEADERIFVYFGEELSRIEKVIDDVYRNKSVIDDGGVPSSEDIKRIESNRLIVLMYLRSIFKILCEHLDK
jgi:hypothetical protein